VACSKRTVESTDRVRTPFRDLAKTLTEEEAAGALRELAWRHVPTARGSHLLAEDGSAGLLVGTFGTVTAGAGGRRSSTLATRGRPRKAAVGGKRARGTGSGSEGEADSSEDDGDGGASPPVSSDSDAPSRKGPRGGKGTGGGVKTPPSRKRARGAAPPPADDADDD
jgi:hypothetical protein